MTTAINYLEPTQESGRAFFRRNVLGPVVMLNLLRFRAFADYSATPDLAPSSPISGEDAYGCYMTHTLPHLKKSGGEVLFFGKGGQFLIGPVDERWDAVMLVQQASMSAFLEFASNPEYMTGMGHRIAALEDSRLLPLWKQAPERGPHEDIRPRRRPAKGAATAHAFCSRSRTAVLLCELSLSKRQA